MVIITFLFTILNSYFEHQTLKNRILCDDLIKGIHNLEDRIFIINYFIFYGIEDIYEILVDHKLFKVPLIYQSVPRGQFLGA